MAVDKVGGVGGQKDRRTHQVLRVPPAARRGLGHDELVEGVAASVRLALPKGGSPGGGDIARADAVALDVGPAVLRADVPGEHLQPALGCGVGGNGLPAQLGLKAGDQAADLPLIGDVGNAAVGVDALGGVIGQGLSRLA